MSATARRLATYEDLLALPQHVHAEVLGGQLVTAPAPLPEHGLAQLACGGTLDDRFGFGRGGGSGGWWILLEVDVRLGPHDIARPDLAGWRHERLPNPWGVRPIEVVPDWVCEVLSPSSARWDLQDKKRLYGEAGVPFYWIVDPARRTLQVLRREPPQGSAWHWVEVGVYCEEDEAALPPFQAQRLRVAALLPPRPPEPAPSG